jgi:hypothetical protein
MIAEKLESVTTIGPIAVERLRSDLPTFCEPIIKDDDPSMAIGINFWPPKLDELLVGVADPQADYELGVLFGDEAICFIRDRYGPALLTVVLMFMGERLYREQRCPGPLERGFLDRIRDDCPDVVDAVVMEHFRQHPQQLN